MSRVVVGRIVVGRIVVGRIVGVVDHGTIKMLKVAVAERGGNPDDPAVQLVAMDHSAFRWMVEGRGGMDRIIGANVEVTDNEEGRVVAFDDEVTTQ